MAVKSKSRRAADLPNRLVQDKKTGKITSLAAQVVNTETVSITNSLSGVNGTFTGDVDITGSFGSVQDGAGTYEVAAGSFVTTVIHTGVGTVSIPTEGWPKGSQISIVTSGTMTLDWGTNAKGVSIGNSVKMASGTFDGGKWFYSESTAN
jgi:hypothetical protein